MKKIWLLWAFFTAFISFAQNDKTQNIWTFGKNVGINFNQDTPQVFKTAMLAKEGCASMADENGNLLLYSNGINIWNHQHEIIENGDSLKGHISATQSVIIVPQPAQKGIYYVFTNNVPVVLGQDNPVGIYYSVVDMRANNGLGKVVEKNTAIHSESTEKLQAIYHQNGQDIWLLMHENKSKNFFAYLLTAYGLQINPMISKIGMVHNKAGMGYMTASPSGKKLALAIHNAHKVEVFDFDNLTGKLSNPKTFGFQFNEYPYGLSFSADESKLYVSVSVFSKKTQYIIYQLYPDFEQNSFQNSYKFIHSSTIHRAMALKLGQDGNIYVAKSKGMALDRIIEANEFYPQAKYEIDALVFSKDTALIQSFSGLPNGIVGKEKSLETFTENKEPSQKIETGKIFFRPVLFEYNKAIIQTQYLPNLEDIIQYLKENPNQSVKIIGHTDNMGSDNNNLILSQKRAKVVADYFISKGITKQRISYEGLGEKKPLVSNVTPAGRQKNRRIEFLIK